MGTEIERKFLVVSDDWKSLVSSSNSIRQGYLSANDLATVRIRIVDDAKALLTVKGKVVGITRDEFEYEVPLEDGKAMLELSRPRVVEKRRHLVPLHGVTWEIDIFEGHHAGLVMAEVELQTADQAVELPHWIGKEVSQDERYANASLSRNPGVPTPDPGKR
jgi:adenylate cyclase